MKPVIWLVLALMVFPLALAFPCSQTLDSAYCQEVANSNMPEFEKDQIFSSLLYPYNKFPNHNFTQSYNLNITVEDPPDNTTIYNSREIRNAWFSFLAVFPSVYENGSLYVPPLTNILCWHDHDVVIPQNYRSSGYPSTKDGDCATYYSLTRNDAKVLTFVNNDLEGVGNYTEISIDSDGQIRSHLDIDTTVKVTHYTWQRECCKRWKNGACRSYCYKCKYSHTSYLKDHVGIDESKTVKLYDYLPEFSIFVIDEYYNTTKGNFSAGNHSYFRMSFKESNYSEQKYYYDLLFEKKPYYFAFLEAHPFNFTTTKNIHIDNKTFFVKNKENCSLYAYNHFFNRTEECNLTPRQENLEPLSKEEPDADLSFLIYIIIFVLILYIIYKLAKSQFGKIALIMILLVLVIPVTIAEEEECGITNLASCLPEKMYDYFLYIINAPLLPMLFAIKHLLTAEVSIDLFQHLWSIIRYIIGFFYIFFFLYAGYMFLTAGGNPIKRAHAKDLLRNTVLMIVLIQGSFYIYGLVLSLSSIMDNAILQMIDPHFFLITADNITNIGLEFIFALAYASTLFWTMLMLTLRYIMVSFGVVLFPIGLFCYYIPPLKAYGRFIINMLAIFIFIAFFDLLIILACSILVEAPVFADMKILVMIICFSIVNYTIWLAIKFALKRSVNGSLKDDLNQAVKYVAMLA